MFQNWYNYKEKETNPQLRVSNFITTLSTKRPTRLQEYSRLEKDYQLDLTNIYETFHPK